MTYFIDRILMQPTSIAIHSGIVEHRISHVPSPPNEEIQNIRIENLSAVLTFLSVHFFVSLPSEQQTQFTRSLCKPIASSVLNNLLVPFLPSSFELLPPFLDLVRRAVVFEEHFVVGMLGNDVNDRLVKEWSNGLCGHYERQRRTQILDSSRTIIISPENSADRFLVDVNILPVTYSTTSPVQAEEAYKDEVKDDAWGLEDDIDSGAGTPFEVEAEGWGFDDEVLPDSEADPSIEQKVEERSPSVKAVNGEHENDPDPSDAWGWNDNDDVEALEEAVETDWDDPWGDEPGSSSAHSPPPSIASPKVATRLEKAANKGKKHLSDTSPTASPGISPLSPPHSETTLTDPKNIPSLVKQSSRNTMHVPKESYSVSGRIKQIIRAVEDVLKEGKQFAAAKIFQPSNTTPTPGSVIFQCIPSILDLYMALYPVKFHKDLKVPECGMQFSNDCLYLSNEAERVRNIAAAVGVPASIQERLSECTKRYKLLADSWYHDVIVRRFPVMLSVRIPDRLIGATTSVYGQHPGAGCAGIRLHR